jgi:hypothetical protein
MSRRYAEAARCLDARGDDVRVLRQAEIVVAGERDERSGGLRRSRGARSSRDREPATQLSPLERLELVARELVERRSRAAGT